MLPKRNASDIALSDSGNDGFFSRATDEPVKMRAHRDTRLYFHTDTVLCDAVDRRAAHVWARRVDHLRIDARADCFQNRLASSFRCQIDCAGSVALERNACLIRSN